jgi:DNA-directed RNA polymerase subunit alpha
MDADLLNVVGFRVFLLNHKMTDQISIQCLNCDTIESGSCRGQFLINKLKPGQGITIGNQLRRVLLNDLGGVAITAVRIAGINHPFSTIPGVREDILEILLNLKGIVVQSDTKSPQFGRLTIQGPTVVTADLIQLSSTLKLINPNHYIMTISTANIVEIEFKFEYGVGYKLASQTILDQDEQYLQLDAVFMPVQKVDFKIENVYDNTNKITERLLLDIWTNGSILPKKALKSAAQITIDLFTFLVKDDNDTTEKNLLVSKASSINIEPYTNIAIEELQLSVRAYNCLKKAQINTVGDLLQYSPEKLQELKNFGRKSSVEVFSTLKNKLGIILK